MASPSTRCFPSDDFEFLRDLAAEMAATGDRLELVAAALRMKYPQVRITEREAIAALDERPVWYCYRDGRVVAGKDGAGAMRAWSRIERLTNQSLDLIEWSCDVLRRSRATAITAERAVDRRRGSAVA